MSCMSPCAPRLETAFGLKADSRNIIAAIRFGSTPYFFDASAMMLARYCGTGAGKPFDARVTCGREPAEARPTFTNAKAETATTRIVFRMTALKRFGSDHSS